MMSSDLEALRPRGPQRELSHPLAYNWWQERLAAEFFGPEQSGTLVFFFIDSAELERLHDPSQATDLCQAVSSRLLWNGDLFGSVTSDVARWRRGTQADPPPCLPLLAATVLAAVNMYAPMGPGAPAYYPRLAEILKPPGPAAPWHRDKLERRYNDVKDLWICLDHWLADCGDGRGVSTIRQGPLTKIGYALSQAIIRATDHPILEEFFRTPGVGSLAPIDGSRLLRELKSWGRTASLSRRLRQALASEAENALLVPLLTALAEAWSGGRNAAQQHSSGTPPARLLVTAEEDFIEGWQLNWFLPAVPGVEADTLGYAGGAFSAVLEVGQEMYRLSGQVPEPVSALVHGLSARGDLLDIRVFPGRHVLALCEDPVAGAWMETSELGLFEQYVFLYDGVGERQLRGFTDAAGLPWYQPEPVAESGWSVSGQIEFTDESQLAAALSATSITGLRHTPTRTMRLQGGLRVRPDLGRRHNYLLGAEPDLVLSAPAGTPDVLLLNGEPQAVPANGLLRLRGMGLAAKEHVLELGGIKTHLRLHPLAETRCAASNEGGEPGAALPGHVVVPLRGDAGFLTAQGHYVPARHQREPAWWADRAPELREGGLCRVHIPHEAVWLVVTVRGKPRAIRLLKAQEPDIGRLSRPEQDFWNSLVLDQQDGTPHSALWRRYRTAVFGHHFGEVPGHV